MKALEFQNTSNVILIYNNFCDVFSYDVVRVLLPNHILGLLALEYTTSKLLTCDHQNLCLTLEFLCYSKKVCHLLYIVIVL